jgi:hypothetical protein
MSDANKTVKALLENRIEFKFYAAEKHLQLLSDMEAKGESPNNSVGRLNWELEIEELLFHLIDRIARFHLRRVSIFHCGLRGATLEVI